MESDKYKSLFSTTGKDFINILDVPYIRSIFRIFILLSILFLYVIIILRGFQNVKLNKKISIERKEEERLKDEKNRQYIKELTKKIQILEETQNSQRNVIQDVKDDFNRKLNIHSNKQLNFENIEDEIKKMHEFNEERNDKYFVNSKKLKQNVDEFTNLLTKRYVEIEYKINSELNNLEKKINNYMESMKSENGKKLSEMELEINQKFIEFKNEINGVKDSIQVNESNNKVLYNKISSTIKDHEQKNSTLSKRLEELHKDKISTVEMIKSEISNLNQEIRTVDLSVQEFRNFEENSKKETKETNKTINDNHSFMKEEISDLKTKIEKYQEKSNTVEEKFNNKIESVKQDIHNTVEEKFNNKIESVKQDIHNKVEMIKDDAEKNKELIHRSLDELREKSDLLENVILDVKNNSAQKHEL